MTPEDVCARAYLISYGRTRVPNRTDYIIWMIEHHPEWDGFAVDSNNEGTQPADEDRIRAAWTRQSGPDQQNGVVLHHAEIYFISRDPELSETLLEQAIRFEPEVPYHTEELGALYGTYLSDNARHASFVEKARARVLSSFDPLLLAAALTKHSGKGGGDPWEALLRARLGELAGDKIPKLSSAPSRYWTSPQCAPVRSFKPGCPDDESLGN